MTAKGRGADYLAAELERSVLLMRRLAADRELQKRLLEAAERTAEALRAGGKLLLAGNGGSAADAQHLAAELVGRLGYERPGLAALALTTDSSALTAIGNDYGFEQVFARQVEALGRQGDLLLAISTSGNSRNLLLAAEAARRRGLGVLALVGRDGGRLAPLSDLAVIVPEEDTQKIQEAQITLGHLLCALVEQALHPRKG